MYSLQRRLAKIEKERGGTGVNNLVNDILQRVGESPCATVSEAYLRLLRLMQAPDWIERLRAAGIGDPPPSDR